MAINNYEIGDRIVIAQGLNFVVGKIYQVLPELSLMQRAVYQVCVGWDIDANKKFWDVPEEMIVCKHDGSKL